MVSLNNVSAAASWQTPFVMALGGQDFFNTRIFTNETQTLPSGILFQQLGVGIAAQSPAGFIIPEEGIANGISPPTNPDLLGPIPVLPSAPFNQIISGPVGGAQGGTILPGGAQIQGLGTPGVGAAGLLTNPFASAGFFANPMQNFSLNSALAAQNQAFFGGGFNPGFNMGFNPGFMGQSSLMSGGGFFPSMNQGFAGGFAPSFAGANFGGSVFANPALNSTGFMFI